MNFLNKNTSQLMPLVKVAMFSMASLFMLSACSPEQQVANIEMPATTRDISGIRLETLSTKSWLVTGGDVLVAVHLEADFSSSNLKLSLNGVDVSANMLGVAGGSRRQILLQDLPLGVSELVATLDGKETNEKLIITNYPSQGPIISGPHQTPYICQSNEFEKVTGVMLGEAEDEHCSVTTQVDYVYWSTSEQQFKPFRRLLNGLVPEDLGEITKANGETVGFIVRVETGTVNRAIYEIAMLHDPAEGALTPWHSSQGWNGKLVYTHGGGCRRGWYRQGSSTGGVMRKGLLEMGYAISSASLNVFGQNCNDLLASETHIMVKERFIEHYGVPTYTIGTGGSGGSYQSHQTADNYPGIFDGIIVSSSFPDVTSATIFTLADARLLHYYFNETDTESFTQEQQRAVSGFGSFGSIANLAAGAARLDPVYRFDTPVEEQGGEIAISALETNRYHPSIPDGIRATVYDHTVNVYGRVDDSLIAARPLDNVGVQYGLQAFNEGLINAQQFIALNRDIGGFDRDMNHIPQRHVADAQASKMAIESGRVLFGGGGLANTPIIDYRSYTDNRENGDIHMIVHQFSTRERLLNANGHADNHVMTVGGLWGFEEDRPDLGNLFTQMDSWLMAMLDDTSTPNAVVKMRNAKPDTLVDNCWDNSGVSRENIAQEQTFSGESRCNQLYRAYPTARQVAGGQLSNDVIKCQLKVLDREDYLSALSDSQWMELQQVFILGVCDWDKGDASGASYQGTWASFGPSTVNRL